MASRTPLTDADIESERKNGAHERAQKIDNAFTSILIVCMWAAAGITLIGMIFCAILYGCYLRNPASVSKDSVQIIAAIASHALAAVAGYVIRLSQRSTGINT
jgi:hypothetical protein